MLLGLSNNKHNNNQPPLSRLEKLQKSQLLIPPIPLNDNTFINANELKSNEELKHNNIILNEKKETSSQQYVNNPNSFRYSKFQFIFEDNIPKESAFNTKKRKKKKKQSFT